MTGAEDEGGGDSGNFAEGGDTVTDGDAAGVPGDDGGAITVHGTDISMVDWPVGDSSVVDMLADGVVVGAWSVGAAGAAAAGGGGSAVSGGGGGGEGLASGRLEKSGR